jgi:hypothetical protein
MSQPASQRVVRPATFWRKLVTGEGVTVSEQTKVRFTPECRLAIIFCRAFSTHRGAWTRHVVASITRTRSYKSFFSKGK